MEGGAIRGAGADQLSFLVTKMVETKVGENMLRLFQLDHESLKVRNSLSPSSLVDIVCFGLLRIAVRFTVVKCVYW